MVLQTEAPGSPVFINRRKIHTLLRPPIGVITRGITLPSLLAQETNPVEFAGGGGVNTIQETNPTVTATIV